MEHNPMTSASIVAGRIVVVHSPVSCACDIVRHLTTRLRRAPQNSAGTSESPVQRSTLLADLAKLAPGDGEIGFGYGAREIRVVRAVDAVCVSPDRAAFGASPSPSAPPAR